MPEADTHLADLSAAERHRQMDRELDYDLAQGRVVIYASKAIVEPGSCKDLTNKLSDLASATDPLLGAAIDRYESNPMDPDSLESPEERISASVGLALSAWTSLFAQSLLNVNSHKYDEQNRLAWLNLIDAISISLDSIHGYHEALSYRIAKRIDKNLYTILDGLREDEVRLTEALRPFLPGAKIRGEATLHHRDELENALKRLNPQELYRLARIVRDTALEELE